MKARNILILAALLMAGCATNGANDNGSATAETANQAIAQAEKSTKQVDAVGFAWRDTGKLITDAKAAVEKGDFQTAEKLATAANRQSELAYQQYANQQQKTASK